MNLLKEIDKIRNHISRSAWFKEAAEEKLKSGKQPKVAQDEIRSDIIDSFLDNM